MTTNRRNRYVLEAIDPETASITDEVSFETNTGELCRLLSIEESHLKANASYPLEGSAVSALKSRYGLNVETRGFKVWLRAHDPNDDLPYQVHTGRELAMMLAGTKPLAAFSDYHPKYHDLDIIPEREFEPHVSTGRIFKRERIEPPAANAPIFNGERLGSRRVLYALPGDEWRIDAYLRLCDNMKLTGWTAVQERKEGALLGYEDWEIEYHMTKWSFA
jgi:hypothetical protein